MSNPLISVIVPCYNVEKFLPLCFKCFDEQNYKNLHIIFINDGSTDGTLKLLEDYCGKNPQNTLITGENVGVGSARNKGLKEIKGEFFAFHDADDILTNDHFELLVKAVCKSGAGMAVCDVVRIPERKAEKFSRKAKTRSEKFWIYDKKRALIQYFSQEKFDYPLKNKLFSSEILRDSGACFLENCRYGEESYFFYKYLVCCEKTVYYKAKTCIYVQCKGSLMHSAFNETRLDIFTNINAVLAEISADERFGFLIPYVKSMRAGYSVGILYFILNSTYKNGRVIAEITRTFGEDIKYLKKCPEVAFYKKALLPVCAAVAKVVFFRHLKKFPKRRNAVKESVGIINK